MGLTEDNGSFADVGSACFKGQNCDKEPDWSIVPRNVPIGNRDHVPSLILESGVSESYCIAT